MTQHQQPPGEKWVDKLIRFFKQMPRKTPDTPDTDYSGWHQTEDAYQKQQQEWLSQVKARKQQKRRGDEKNRK